MFQCNLGNNGYYYLMLDGVLVIAQCKDTETLRFVTRDDKEIVLKSMDNIVPVSSSYYPKPKKMNK